MIKSVRKYLGRNNENIKSNNGIKYMWLKVKIIKRVYSKACDKFTKGISSINTHIEQCSHRQLINPCAVYICKSNLNSGFTLQTMIQSGKMAYLKEHTWTNEAALF